MPGVVKLIHRNHQGSVKAIYKYANKWQLRSIIRLWESDNDLTHYSIIVAPHTTDEPEIIKDLKQ
jgi:hypothetical protein